MAKIFYSMAGEGRGHAIRVRVMVDELRQQHDITLFAPGDAYALLAPCYEGTDVRVFRIPGLHFHYSEAGRVNFLKTAGRTGKYLWQLPRLIAALERRIRAEEPALIITDFEPALPRAALQCGVPFISLNHQHFLVSSDLSDLPWHLRRSAALMSLAVRGYYSGQVETITSSFYFPPLKPWYQHVKQVGVLLRPSILRAAHERGDHVLAYIRKAAFGNVLEALRGCGRQVRVYGLGRRPSEGNLRFREIDEHGFLADLASCEAVVSTAGNQLVGEALYLEKPVLAMPEANNFEQFINAYFLEQSGTGAGVEMEALTAAGVRRFLERGAEFRTNIQPERLNGNHRALELVRQHLPLGNCRLAAGS